MKREEAITKFREEERGFLAETKQRFQTNMQKKAPETADCLRKVFTELNAAAHENKKDTVMFIHFSLLRIDFLNRTYRFLAQAMDARWYMDTEPAQVMFSMEDVFSVFNDARERLDSDSRKYMGKINRYDIDTLLMEAGMECNLMLAAMLRFVFRDIGENRDFQELCKLDTWGIRWGEYRDGSELIACADREKKNQTDWNRALREAEDQEGRLVSSFWYEAGLRDTDCGKRTMSFIWFEGCTLSGLDFSGADLIGARFRDCTVSSCSFRDALMRQAIFEGCKWESCDFQGADLTEAVFPEEDLPALHLDAGQLQAILLDGREGQ